MSTSRETPCIYLCFKSCILVSNDGPKGWKHVVFIDDIIKTLLDSNIYAKTPSHWDSFQE